jgi:hypothetical protein
MKRFAVLALVCLTLLSLSVCSDAFGLDPFGASREANQQRHSVIPDLYPGADAKEFGQLRWVLQLADQDIGDFSNFRSADEQGISACRSAVAFSAYFLAVEQYHKFPAWQGLIQKAFDRLNRKMLERRMWQYWEQESRGVARFEPGLDRPYPAMKDPVAYGNIMYSGHLSHMLNLYQALYNDRKWDRPGSLVLRWDDRQQFVYDNKTLQDVLFRRFRNNPVPGIECEPNTVSPACNTHPMLGWLLFDRTHGTDYFGAAHPLFDRFFSSSFINPETKELGAFYLIKQGWVFSSWNPRYGNGIDSRIKEMTARGADFHSSGNDGWTGMFMHAWNPDLIEELYPYMKRAGVVIHKDGSAALKNDPLIPEASYGFFAALAAEVGDRALRNGLLKTADRLFHPVWEGGTYHYPFADRAGASAKGVQKMAAADSPSAKGPCCISLRIIGQGDAGNTKTMSQGSDLSDRLIGMARALPPKGLWLMHNRPFDKEHFNEPAITDLDPAKTPLKRAIYDRLKKALIVSTLGSGEPGGFRIIRLDPAKTYSLVVNGITIKDISGVKEHRVTLEAGKAHDIILVLKK